MKHYHISLIVDAETREEALKLFKEIADEIIKYKGMDMSAHDDTFMPYVWCDSYWREDSNEHLWTTPERQMEPRKVDPPEGKET